MNPTATFQNVSLTEQIFNLIAELTTDARHNVREQRERLHFSTPLRDQVFILDEIAVRLHVRIRVKDPWKTTIGEVLRGMQ